MFKLEDTQQHLTYTRGKIIMRASSVIIFSLYLLTATSADAGDFANKPFLFRALLALDRSSNYASTAGRQASVAFPGESSVNPAANDFARSQRTSRPQYFTLTSINAVSDSDAWITALAGTLSYSSPGGGTWSPAYAYTDTIDSNNTVGLQNIIRSHEFFLGYSKAISESWSFGAQGRLSSAFFREESFRRDVGFQPIRADTDIWGIDVSVGAMGRTSSRHSLGFVATIGWSDAEVEVTNLTSLGPLPPGTELDRSDGSARVWSLAGGYGYTPSENFGIFTDLQYVYMSAEDKLVARFDDRSIDTTRLSVGIEARPSAKIALRVGTTVDTQEAWTVSAGAGIYIFKGIPIDLAYQYNAAPELEKELGQINIFSASLAFAF